MVQPLILQIKKQETTLDYWNLFQNLSSVCILIKPSAHCIWHLKAMWLSWFWSLRESIPQNHKFTLESNLLFKSMSFEARSRRFPATNLSQSPQVHWANIYHANLGVLGIWQLFGQWRRTLTRKIQYVGQSKNSFCPVWDFPCSYYWSWKCLLLLGVSSNKTRKAHWEGITYEGLVSPLTPCLTLSCWEETVLLSSCCKICSGCQIPVSKNKEPGVAS